MKSSKGTRWRSQFLAVYLLPMLGKNDSLETGPRGVMAVGFDRETHQKMLYPDFDEKAQTASERNETDHD